MIKLTIEEIIFSNKRKKMKEEVKVIFFVELTCHLKTQIIITVTIKEVFHQVIDWLRDKVD